MNAEDVQTMVLRCNSTKQPYRDAWIDLSTRATNSLVTWAATPYTGSDGDDAFNDFMLDAGANMLPMTIYYLATGDTNHAEKVVDSLLAYANASPRPGSIAAGQSVHNAGPISARGLIPLLYAYDLVYSYPGFNQTDKDTIETWFVAYTNEFRQCVQDWVDNDYYDKQYWANHTIAAGALGNIAVGTVIGDASIVQFGYDFAGNPRDLLDNMTGTILVDSDSEYCSREDLFSGAPFDRFDGEIYDRYRHLTGPNKGLQYATLSKQLLFFSVLIMDRNGINLRNWKGSNGENILMPFEYYSDYYRLMDSSLKDGFYSGEDARMGLTGDRPAIQEAFSSYMDSTKVDYALTAINRLDPDNMIDYYMGHIVLTHGNDDLDYFSISEFRYVSETDTQRDWVFYNVETNRYDTSTLWGKATAASPHPYFDCSGLADQSISLDAFNSIEIRMKHESGIGGDVNVYWNRAEDGSYTLDRRAAVPVVDDDDYTVYTFDVSGNAEWNGVLDSIRIDPFSYTGANGKGFWVDYVRFQYAGLTHEENWALGYWDTLGDYIADADDDLDGLSNHEEYCADTNPTNATSNLRMLDVSASGAEAASVSYQNGGTNADVYVEHTSDLVVGGWTEIATNPAPDSTTNSTLHTGSGNPAFYRLRATRNG